MGGFRVQSQFMFFRSLPRNDAWTPAGIIRIAIADALVLYYLLAGRYGSPRDAPRRIDMLAALAWRFRAGAGPARRGDQDTG